ncbi:MAG: hypothetical protein BMS9Abin26_1600 [Gammaproteobacteria bacterium]|nr:MAG: hypothetical protein BMS9Abin26_1600 [Gammaproteobacteria bacterium]
MSMLSNLSVGKKIAAGFAVLAILMVVTIGIAMNRINADQEIIDRVFTLRVPTVLASNQMLDGVNSSLAALRGYMILGADKFKTGRLKAWEKIDGSYERMQENAKNWTNPENVRRMEALDVILTEFKKAQQEIEDISGTIKNTPATEILVTQAAPRASIMIAEITNMINMEGKQPATRERKDLLGMMADVRGTTGLSLANIRAFLLTGDEKFNQKFQKFWSKNVKRFADLSNNAHLLTAKQQVSFKKFSAARAEFKDLPPKMFKIRGSRQWNLANYWLGSKAAPRAGKIVKTLDNMIENQQRLTSDDITAAKTSSTNLINTMIVLGIIAVIIAVIVAFFVVRMITRPVATAAAGLKDIAQGDLTQRWQVNSKDELGSMLGDMNMMADALTDIVTDVRNGADLISAASSEVSEGNMDLSQRTEEQASSLEETASSMEEMTSTVKQNADNARQANQLAEGARDQAEQGGEVVGRAVEAMAEINASSKKIADIISVIDEIAFQTNLLALNAAVEAARAGEQGRGFAVVASEVRSLAGRSAEAAKEIKDLISDSVGKVEQGSRLVDESGQTLQEIVGSVKKVTDIVSEIAAASEEQASGIDQVNKAIMQIDEMTQQNAALVEEASAASRSMDEQSTNLQERMAFFKVGSSTASSAAPAQSANISSDVKPAQKAASARASETAANNGHVEARAQQAKTGTDDEWSEF